MRPSLLSLALASSLFTLGPLGCPDAADQEDRDTAADPAAEAQPDGQPGTQGAVTPEPTPKPEPQAIPAPADAELQADPTHSKIGFAVARATSEHIGHFDRFDATLTLEGGKPTGLRIKVDTGSVAADRQGLTSHLKSPDFFDVGNFPTATFTAKTFTPNAEEGADAYVVEGSMHLHGVERTLKFPATIAIEAERVVGTASLEISAKAFGIDYEGMEQELAEDAVSLEIELLFSRVGSPSPGSPPPQ
ncbi:MAG: YceI family protein [Myxococcales bacterium]|nr:YceI family protein [Myxococcales bacterium]